MESDHAARGAGGKTLVLRGGAALPLPGDSVRLTAPPEALHGFDLFEEIRLRSLVDFFEYLDGNLFSALQVHADLAQVALHGLGDLTPDVGEAVGEEL